jgi:hypothetical protein
MVQFLQNVFTDESIEPRKKKELSSIIKKTLDEIESGGNSDATNK